MAVLEIDEKKEEKRKKKMILFSNDRIRVGWFYTWYYLLMLPFFFSFFLIGFLMAWKERGIFTYKAPAEGMICMTEKWNRMIITHGGGQRQKRQTKRRNYLYLYIMKKGF